jgi:hypothetical protein
MKKKNDWINHAISKKESFTNYCKRKGFSKVTLACIRIGMKSKNPLTRKRAHLAKTLREIG